MLNPANGALRLGPDLVRTLTSAPAGKGAESKSTLFVRLVLHRRRPQSLLSNLALQIH